MVFRIYVSKKIFEFVDIVDFSLQDIKHIEKIIMNNSILA